MKFAVCNNEGKDDRNSRTSTITYDQNGADVSITRFGFDHGKVGGIKTDKLYKVEEELKLTFGIPTLSALPPACLEEIA